MAGLLDISMFLVLISLSGFYITSFKQSIRYADNITLNTKFLKCLRDLLKPKPELDYGRSLLLTTRMLENLQRKWTNIKVDYYLL